MSCASWIERALMVLARCAVWSVIRFENETPIPGMPSIGSEPHVPERVEQRYALLAAMSARGYTLSLSGQSVQAEFEQITLGSPSAVSSW